MMKYSVLLALFILAAAVTAGAQAEPPANANTSMDAILTSGRVVAKVNDEVVVLREVARRAMITGLDLEKARELVITDKLFIIQAKKENLKVTDEQLEETLKESLSHFASLEEFTKEVLEPLKISMDEYRADMAGQILKDRYLSSKIGAQRLSERSPDFVIDTFIAPAELKEYFEFNKERFKKPDKIKLRQIILTFSDFAQKAEKKQLADTLTEKLKKGSSFESLARQYSDVKAASGGEWDWMTRGNFRPEVESVVYDLEKGGVSGIITTDKSFIIAKVEDKLISDPSFSDPDIQEEIRKILVNKKISAGAEAIRETLMKNASIKIEREILEKVPVGGSSGAGTSD